MALTDDIRSKPLLHAKGLLFLLAGLIAVGGILVESPHLRTVALLGIGIWSFCRFYYYLFYVLENYAGRGRKYAGLLDALGYVFLRREKSGAGTGDLSK
jgi:hypothetical protein